MKVLITDGVHPLLIEGFEELGCSCDYEPDMSYESVQEIIEDYDGLIINSKIKVDKAFIDQASQLKFVGRLGSGLEIIDLEYAESKGIHCFNSPEGNCNAVAEQAVGMLLSLFNNINKAAQDVKNWHWNREENRGEEMEGKTIGIYGYGHTGSTFAKRLRGFDVTILAYDKFKTGFGNEFVQEVNEADIFLKSDVLSLHLPLTEETNHLVNEQFINKFSKSIYLLNTSRGKVVNLKDLKKAIDNKKVKGVGLDVLENERLNQYQEKEKVFLQEMLKNDKVLVTPHIAGWTYESKEKIANTLLNKIKSILFSDL